MESEREKGKAAAASSGESTATSLGPGVEDRDFEILAVNQFNSSRKRMSALVWIPDSDRSRPASGVFDSGVLAKGGSGQAEEQEEGEEKRKKKRKKREGGRYVLMCKGADNVMFARSRLPLHKLEMTLAFKTLEGHLTEFAAQVCCILLLYSTICSSQ